MNPVEKTEATFEKAITRLEGLVRDLEAGQISLEHALEVYADGVELIKYCRKKLERAEQQIAILSEGIDGEPVLECPSSVDDGSIAE